MRLFKRKNQFERLLDAVDDALDDIPDGIKRPAQRRLRQGTEGRLDRRRRGRPDGGERRHLVAPAP